MTDYRGKTDPFSELKVSGLDSRQSSTVSLNTDGRLALDEYQGSLMREDGLPSSRKDIRKSEALQIMKTRAEKWDRVREETGVKDVEEAIGLIEKSQM